MTNSIQGCGGTLHALHDMEVRAGIPMQLSEGTAGGAGEGGAKNGAGGEPIKGEVVCEPVLPVSHARWWRLLPSTHADVHRGGDPCPMPCADMHRGGDSCTDPIPLH